LLLLILIVILIINTNIFNVDLLKVVINAWKIFPLID